jgi:hypothetical protein
MKADKANLVLGCVLGLACILAVNQLARRYTSGQLTRQMAQRQSRPIPLVNTALTMQPANVGEAHPALEVKWRPAEKSAVEPANAENPMPANKKAAPVKEPLQDPLAREALIFVGVDPEAEAYWYGAINDPSLPPNERQDLIEDLNEEGLPDPKHPTPEDLPLILSRIELIETVGPFAMDEVNMEAFAEAYKDLVNLLELAAGQR